MLILTQKCSILRASFRTIKIQRRYLCTIKNKHLISITNYFYDENDLSICKKLYVIFLFDGLIFKLNFHDVLPIFNLASKRLIKKMCI